MAASQAALAAASPAAAVADPGTAGAQHMAPIPLAPGIEPPELIHNVEPEWSRLGNEVRSFAPPVLQLVVTESGAVAEVKVIKAGDPEITALVLEAIRQWRYKPATRSGRPVAVELVVTVRFNSGNA